MTLPDFRVESIGLVGPGLADWPAARAVLRGQARWQSAPARVDLPPILPPAERRRTSLAVRLALASGHACMTASGRSAADIASVFSSSGGDGLTCHQICETLAGPDRRVSPTQFHNSVHNAPSGYWGIAMRAAAASTSLCAHDASFGAGLLDALAQVATTAAPVLLVVYDAPYPEPLFAARPIPDAFGVALLLAPADGDASSATPATDPCGRFRLALAVSADAATPMDDAGLEALRATVPTARALPLLAGLAGDAPFEVVLDHLPPIAADRPARRLRVRGRIDPPDGRGR